jgi:hypothetical protein
MGKREYRSAGVLIILLVVSLLTARHFSARRLRVPAVVSPVSDISLSEEPPVEDAIVPAEEEQETEKIVQSIPVVPPEETKEEIPHPDWFNKMYALYEGYYPSWQSGKSVASVASVPGTVSPSTPQKIATPSSIVSSGVTATTASSRIPAGSTSSHLASVKPTTPSSSGSSGGVPSGSYTPPDGSGQESDDSGGEGDNDDTEEEENEEEEEQDSQVVTVERTISSSGGTAYITLNVTVNTDISGLIIIENVPQSYTITSASPNYSKKRNGSYTWLMYGQSVQSQTVTYQVSGTGGGTITGSYRSTKGSGSIRGSDTL